MVERQFLELDGALLTSPILSASRNCGIGNSGGSIGDVCNRSLLGDASRTWSSLGANREGNFCLRFTSVSLAYRIIFQHNVISARSRIQWHAE